MFLLGLFGGTAARPGAVRGLDEGLHVEGRSALPPCGDSAGLVKMGSNRGTDGM